MKTLLFMLLGGFALLLPTGFTATSMEDPDTITEPFEFYTDDGCGLYLVAGIVTVRYNENGTELLRFEGTATSMDTGEETTLHVRTVTHDSQQTLTGIVNGVFPGVIQFHQVFHYNLRGGDNGANFIINDFSHCISGN